MVDLGQEEVLGDEFDAAQTALMDRYFQAIKNATENREADFSRPGETASEAWLRLAATVKMHMVDTYGSDRTGEMISAVSDNYLQTLGNRGDTITWYNSERNARAFKGSFDNSFTNVGVTIFAPNPEKGYEFFNVFMGGERVAEASTLESARKAAQEHVPVHKAKVREKMEEVADQYAKAAYAMCNSEKYEGERRDGIKSDQEAWMADLKSMRSTLNQNLGETLSDQMIRGASKKLSEEESLVRTAARGGRR